jgi:riboflavin biosynthesis pyrimidine reductase
VNQNRTTVVSPVEKLDISDVRDPSDINNLTAKQLKIILTRNCVDYKGVFEKEVLREKVLQLWIDCNEKKYNRSSNLNNTSSGNDGSQQNSDDIDESQACKICMEREINCVLLECGHMLTCVTCGRKLAECPVCRQNVSRCVRTFRG